MIDQVAPQSEESRHDIMMYQDSGTHAFQRGRASRKSALSRLELEDVDERGKSSAGWTTKSTCSRVALAEAFRPKAGWMVKQVRAMQQI